MNTVLSRIPEKPSTKALSRTGASVRVCFVIPASCLAEIDRNRAILKKLTGKNVSRSLLYREGSLALVRDLRKQANLALRGRLHAKPRKGI